MTTAVAEQVTAGWIPDATTFGARLSLVRQRMAWGNVKEAATQCGLPAESWRQWERDGVEPRRLVQVTRQIAGRTGCNFLWLLTGDENGATGPNRRYGEHVLQPRPVGHPDETIRPPKLPGSRRSVINRARYAA